MAVENDSDRDDYEQLRRDFYIVSFKRCQILFHGIASIHWAVQNKRKKYNEIYQRRHEQRFWPDRAKQFIS